MNTDKERIKRDRTARLIRLVNVLYQNPKGLHVAAIAQPILQETSWHPSQKLELKKDDTVIMTLNVVDSWDLRSWILGWGDEVEVLEPESLRRQIQLVVDSLADIYNHKKLL